MVSRVNLLTDNEARKEIEIYLGTANFKINWDSRRKNNGKYVYDLFCEVCGSVESRRLDLLRKQAVPICHECNTIKYTKQLRNRGIQYKGRNSNHIHVKCLQCKYEWEIQQSKVNSAICRNCIKNLYTKELLKKNCEYVDRYSKKEGATCTIIIYKNNFGDIREVQAGSLLSGNWNNGVDDIFSNTTYVYLLRIPMGVTHAFKIGISTNPNSRFKSLKLVGNVETTILKEFPNYSMAANYESKLHKYFHKFRLNPRIVGEFSKGKKNRNSQVVDGGTEWFCLKPSRI